MAGWQGTKRTSLNALRWKIYSALLLKQSGLDDDDDGDDVGAIPKEAGGRQRGYTLCHGD